MIRITTTLVSLALLQSCSGPSRTPTRYELEFQAVDDRGDPVHGVTVAIGDTHIGNTDKEGVLRAEVNAGKGERFPLHAPCPDAYQDSEAPSHVVFRDTRGLEGETNSRIQLVIECARRDRVAALLVHADGHAGMPIVIDGVAQGRTGPGGFAHVRLDMQPGSQFQVTLDSSAYPKLRPINPRRTMTLGADDGLFIFDPVFGEAEPEKKKKRRNREHKKIEEPVVEKKRPVRVD